MVESNCRKVLEIEIPADVVQKRLQTIAAQFQKHARLPGFRPGKAPLSLVRQKFQEDIRSQLLQDLVPEYVLAEAQQNNWNAVGTPSVTDVEFGENAPLKFKATLEVMPDIQLKSLDELSISVPEPQVTAEEIEGALQQLRADSATYTNVDARPLQDGDFAAISVQGGAAAKQSTGVKLDEILCEIGGDDTVSEFTENLRGAQPGDERSFEVAYAPDFHDPRLAGKHVSYHVKVLGIKTKQLPELDDDFARELGEFDSLDALRQRVSDDLLESKRRQGETEARRAMRKQLVEAHDFCVPDSLVERQVERRVDRLRRHLASQGMDPARVDWAKVRASQREEALEEVKSSLILEKLADENSLEAEDTEVDREIEQLAKASQQSVEALRARLTSENGLDRIKSRLRIEKALDLVLKNAKIRSLGAGQK